MLGIDASLSSTGYAYQSDAGLVTGRVTTGDLRGPYRLVYIRNQLASVLQKAAPTLVVLEDYAMGARGNNMFHIGELGGILKALIWERSIDLLLLSPTMLKLAITGKGNADRGKAGKGKPEMRKALNDRFGYDIPQNDEADAAGLMIIGEALRGVRQIDNHVGKSNHFKVISQIQVIKGKLQLISKTHS